jgi:hypothetical protein
MPDYRIRLHMKMGKPKVGVRWHPSYDADQVRDLVEKKIRKTIGMSAVQWIDIERIAWTKGDRMDSKKLEMT